MIIQKDIQKIKKCFSEEKKNMEFLMANSILRSAKERVFNRTKGTEGEFFGKYRSTPYKRLRVRNRLQVDYKDLQFTNVFRDDLQTGENEGKIVVGWSTERSENIAIGQESGSKTKNGKSVKQINIPIFAPNEEEVEIAFDEVAIYWDELVIKCLI